MNKIDSLLLDLGIVSIDSIDEEATAKAIMPLAFDCLIVGVQIDIKTWLSWTPLTRSCFVEAAKTLRGIKSPEEGHPIKATINRNEAGEVVAASESDVQEHLHNVTSKVLERISK